MKSQINLFCMLLLASLLAMPMAAQAEPDQLAYASKILKEGSHSAVQNLSHQERTILQATAALKGDHPSEALVLLDSAKSRDPLVALLEAEAHRQQAIHAMREAGSFADNIGQGEMLASADLNRGLGEADARLNSFIDKVNEVSGSPLDILLTGPDVENVFMFDKARNRLYIYQPDADGQLKKVADEYVVTGSVAGDKQRQGDGKTPNGIYRFIKKLQGKDLESRYGPVAFPIDYPNELDKLHNKDGYGIWLHGYPMDVSRRPPQDTRGCFSLSNTSLTKIARLVKLKRSWVIAGENFEFDRDLDKQTLLNSVQRDIKAWQQDWASLDSEAYLSHYHQDFRSGKRDLKAWKSYKRRVNANKAFVEVKFTNFTLMRDPTRWPEGEVVLAEFDQSYRSSNYADQGRKRLYLARDSKTSPWKILLEESLKR